MTQYIQTAKFVMREEDENTYFILNPCGKLLKTNLLGKKIIDFCMEKRFPEEIVAHFLGEYHVDENLLRHDINEFLSKLELAKMMVE